MKTGKFDCIAVGLLLFVLLLNNGCSSSPPKKDLYFRMRPPTSEVPVFHSDKKFGMKVQAETKRFTANPTRNLVTNFDFNNNLLYTSDDRNLAGLDLSGFYTRAFFGVPVEFLLSLDFGKIKVQLLDARTDNRGIYLTGHYAQYRTSVFSELSSCGSDLGLWCDSKQLDESRKLENDIGVSQSGREQKIGLSLAYYFDEKRGVFLSYNRFDARLRMSANRPSGTPTEIESQEAVGAVSHGIGYFLRKGNGVLLAVTLDNVTMNWRSEELSRGVFGLHYSFEF